MNTGTRRVALSLVPIVLFVAALVLLVAQQAAAPGGGVCTDGSAISTCSEF